MAWLFGVLICGNTLSHQIAFSFFKIIPYPDFQEQRTVELNDNLARIKFYIYD